VVRRPKSITKKSAIISTTIAANWVVEINGGFLGRIIVCSLCARLHNIILADFFCKVKRDGLKQYPSLTSCQKSATIRSAGLRLDTASQGSSLSTSSQTLSWRFRDTLDLTLIAAAHGLSDGFDDVLVPVLPLIVTELGLSTVEAGLLLGVRSVSKTLLLYPLSMLADATGRKKGLLIAGLAVSAGAYLSMGAANAFGPLLVLAFLSGVGNATYHPCGTAIAAQRFAHRRAAAISLHGLGGNIGASLMPLLQSAVLAVAGPAAGRMAAGPGWRAAIVACALPAAPLLPLVGIRFPSMAQMENGAKSRQKRPAWSGLTGRVLHNRYVVLLALVYALKGLGSKGLIGMLPLLATERFGMDAAAIGVVVAVYFTVGIFAKALMGWLYSRWGARLALLVPLLLGGALALGIGLLPWQPLLLPLAALMGVVSPISPIILTAAADLCEEEVLATSVGAIYTAYGLGFLSPLVGGWLAARLGWVASYAFFAAATWLAAGVSILLPGVGGRE
jgi:MFS family permease